jgi:hypothetical protein
MPLDGRRLRSEEIAKIFSVPEELSGLAEKTENKEEIMSSKRLMVKGIAILDYGKTGAAGYANFSAPALQEIGTKFTGLHEAIGCGEEFDEFIPKCDLDGDLLLQSFELIPAEKDFQVHALTGSNEITGCRLHKFKAVRLELKGSSGVGRRYEFRFHLSFSDPLGLTKLEGLYNAAPERPLEMFASFTRQAVQQTLVDSNDGTRVDMSGGGVVGEVHATPEQRQAVLDGIEEDAAAPPSDVEGPGMTAAEKKAMRREEDKKKAALRGEVAN